MGTPYFILATGQSNIIGRNSMSWSPNPRAKYWNNQIQNDTDIGTAYTAINGSLMGIAPKYAHNIANADANKDVYFAEYSRGGMGIDHWVGGAFYSLRYSSVGSGKIYVNGSTPSTITAMEVASVDAIGVARRGTGSALNAGEFIWLKQGAAYGKYQINSWSDNPTGSSTPTSVTVYCTPVAYSGTFTEGSNIQVEFQPRFLTMIENSVPAALAAAGKSTVDILLWWQGETDSYPSVNANYATEFNFIMSYLGAKPWWSASTKVIICGINSTANNGLATSDQMNGVLAGLTSGHPEREFCLTASALASNRWQDRWHMTAQGYSEAGDLLINAIYAPPMAGGGGTATYAVSPSTSSVVEGSSVTFTVTTTNVGSTTLYWTNAGTTTAGDFTDSQNSGSFAVTSNSGYFSRTLVNDGISDSGETVVIQIRTGSTSGTVVATASTVSVTDSGGGGTGSITGMSVGSPTTVMDFRTNGAHGFIGGGTIAFGLWNDGPAIPYRDAANNVYIGVPHSENYRFKIPDWSNGATWTLEGPTFMSARDVVEGHYNNRYWIFGGWSEGNSVYHLAHHEWYQTTTTVDGYGGINNYPVFNNRWVNGIGLLTSSNGGASFAVSPDVSSNRLVLVPEPWAVQSRNPLYGFFHPSNIVKEGSYYYACVEQRSLNPAVGSFHDGGVSLIRTTNVTSAVGWEFWNGTSWESVDHNFYQGNNSYQKPHRFFEQLNRNYYVAPNNYNSHMGQALRYHTPSGQWLMFGFSGTSGTCLSYSVSATLASPTFSTIVGISSPDASVYNSSAARFISVFDESATDKNFLNIGNNCTVISTNGADGRGASFSYCEYRRASLTITVSGGSPTPTYSVSPSGSTVAEGASVTFSVTTTNVGSATLYWTNAGTTTGADFSDVQNSGSFGVSFDSGSIVRTLSNDGVTDPGETIVIQIRTGSTSGPIVATATTVSVTDTGGAPTYSVTPSTSSVVEGSSVTFTVATTNVGSTTLYWTNAGTTTAGDFTDSQNSGSFAVSSNSGSVTRTTSADGISDAGETIVIQIRTGSTTGPVVATSSTVSVTESGGGGGGTGNITSMSIGSSTVVMDVRTNGNHGFLSDGTPYGLWLDGPAIPYKDAANNTYVILPHSENYRFKVPDFNNGASWELQGPTLLSARATTEGVYNNRQWLYGGWSEGTNVYALTHHEWYVTTRTIDGVPGFNEQNYTGQVNRRWVNGIGLATSTNGGSTFAMGAANNSTRLVLVPEPWAIQSKDFLYGFFHPSNIVKEGSYYYAFCEQRSLSPGGNANDAGVSMIRTLDVSVATGWEFWNGSAWEGVNHGSYQGNLSGQKPHRFFAQDGRSYYVEPNNYNSHMGQSLRYHTPSGKWLMFGFSGMNPATCIAYSSSATLANPQFTTVTGIPNPDPQIFNSAAARYISVFDETSSDRNFVNIGNSVTVLSTNGGSALGASYSFAQIIKSTLTITVDGASPTPSYNVTPSTTTVTEGAGVTFTVATTNVGSTTLYWTNAGTTTGADFTDSQNSGSFAVSSNSGSFVRTLVNDGVVEGAESIVIQIRTGSTAGPVVATATTVSVTDTGGAPTYSVTPSTSSLNEGSSVSFTVTTTNVGSTTLYWTNAGTTNSADFTDSQNSGSFAVSSNSGSFSRTLVNDLTTEGNETIVIQIRTGSTAGPVVATSSTVIVNDTSVPATPTYSVTPSTSSLNEGSSVTFTVTTTNVGSATLYWTNAGTTTAGDFTDSQNSGSFAVSSNSGSFSKTLVNDLATEGNETIVIQIRTGSTSGSIVAIASTVTVVDSSVTPPASTSKLWVRNTANTAWLDASTVAGFQVRNATDTGWLNKSGTLAGVAVRNSANTGWITFGGSTPPTYALTPTATNVNEGSSVSFNVVTTNFGTGMLYWTTAGTVGTPDFTDGVTSGSVAVTSNAGTIVRTITNDATTEGTETFTISLRTGSTSGPVVATSATVTIADTSVPGVPTYAIAPSASTMNEGESVTFTATTTNVGSATLYWTQSGSVTSADFTDGVSSGTVAISSNTGSVIRTVVNDVTLEGNESFVMQLRTGSTAGPIVATSSSVSITDTSVPTAPSSLTMNRNNLDFYFFPTYTSSYEGTFDVRVTLTTDNFFNKALNASDHIVFAIDDAGVQGSSNPHCGPIIRNGVNLFSTARGFLISRNNGVFSEIWNGTASPVVASLANTSGQVFTPLTGTYTIRLRAGYSTGTGFYENRMYIQISAGTSMYDPVVFSASAPITRPYTGSHRLMIGAISDGFVGANPGNGCTEPSGPGSAYGGYVPFTNYSQGYY